MDNIELARFFDDKEDKTVKITISDYNGFLTSKNKKEKIAKFIYYRLYSRYIKPFEFNNKDYINKYKNGFSMMASLCLLIETLQSFKNGWGESRGKKSNEAFIQFFDNSGHFTELKGKGSDFYKNIRCGILHQGETTGGWKISRKGSAIYDTGTNTINAYRFAEKMKKELSDYRDSLIKSQWDSEIWDNLRTKMRKIIKNCQS